MSLELEILKRHPSIRFLDLISRKLVSLNGDEKCLAYAEYFVPSF